MNRPYDYILLTQNENSLNEECVEDVEKRKTKWVSIFLLLLTFIY
jgi:hypothetical protein